MSQSHSVYIAYASESGNAQMLAEDFAKRCSDLSIQSSLVTLNVLAEQDFAKSQVVYFVSSTGNGEFPSNGKQFLPLLESSDALAGSLVQMAYGLFALGSHSYAHFCGAGQQLQLALQSKQAKSLYSSLFAADDFLALYPSWALAVLSKLCGMSVEEITLQLEDFAKKPSAQYQLADRKKLTTDASSQATYHVILTASDEEYFSYSAGDVVSITPANEAQKVQSVLTLLAMTGHETLVVQGQAYSLLDYLTYQVELTKLSAELIKKTGALCNDWQLLTLASNEEKLTAMLNQYDVIHWLQQYPVPDVAKMEWLAHLMPKSPRYYSVASDGEDDASQIHLCVGLQQQVFEGKEAPTSGLGSGALCQNPIGSLLQVSLEVHPNFHLKINDVSIPHIWVAVGTGIAPFIGFLMKLMQVFPSTRPKITLYFGVRHPEQDFLYQSFLEHCVAEGIIELKMTFSRHEQGKQYVQHAMIEDLTELSEQLKVGAEVYVCGSEPMWDEVETVLQHAIMQGSPTVETAKANWKIFSDSKCHKDIY